MTRKTMAFLVLFALGGTTLSACGAGPNADDAPADATDDLYTCGMHPNVVQHGPGTCPICSMNLTPMNVDDGPAPADGERVVAYWQSPMDPTYVRDAPGKSPMGMDLIPVYADDVDTSDSVKIKPGVLLQIGVETTPVQRTTVFRHVRTIGEVEVGEDQVEVVNLRYSGWIERLYVENSGDPVRRGQVLFDIYSPELVAAEEEYLLALRGQGPDAQLTRSARRKIALWDISDRDIDAIAAAGEARRTMPVRSPINGYVLHKDVVEGARVSAGHDLFRLGNLSKVWITAEIYENDAPWVEVGQSAQAELNALPGEVLEGTVSYIYPTLNPGSRTLSVRLEFDNPGIRLKPGMFATVHVQYRRMDGVIAVPSEAILRSGRRTIAFVALGGGRFEPRDVVVGLQGDRGILEIREGLHEGDEVVTTGQFLIDSESQLQEALRKILAGADGAADDADPAHPDTLWSCPMHPDVIADGPGRCTECGMDLEERDGTADELAQVYGQDGAQPGQYTCPMHPEVISDEAGRCPECGMFLEQVPQPGDGGMEMDMEMDMDMDHAGHDHTHEGAAQ